MDCLYGRLTDEDDSNSEEENWMDTNWDIVQGNACVHIFVVCVCVCVCVCAWSCICACMCDEMNICIIYIYTSLCKRSRLLQDGAP